MRRVFSRWGAWLIVAGGLLIGLALGLLIFYGVPPLPAAQGARDPAGVPATPAGPVATSAPAPVVGAPAPDFTLADLAGNNVSLASFKGQVVVLNFWATWCGPCKLEMPMLEQHYQALQGQKLVVLAVESGDPLSDVQDFVTQNRLTFPVVADKAATVSDDYLVQALPTTFILDAQGIILQKHVGLLSQAQLDDYLKQAGLTLP